MGASSKRVAVVCVVCEAPVEFERDPPFRDMECEFAESTVVVFPPAIFLFEIAVAKLFNGLLERHIPPVEFLASLLGAQECHGGRRKLHGFVAGQSRYVFDLSAIAFAVEAD